MILHGGDYCPEQWIFDFNLIREDVKKLKAANINCITMGMFSWSTLEPTEGNYNVGWLEQVLEIFEANQMNLIIGTPTAARPHWVGQNYPSTSRVNCGGTRELTGNRHNHCMSSVVFREKAEKIIALQLETTLKYKYIHSIHINNEFSGYCYCDECVAKFRTHLSEEYGTIENLNSCWWTTFWSHAYQSFDEIQPPFSFGETSNTPLTVHWERFMTLLHNDYIEFEKSVISRYTDLPVTTNFCGTPFTTEVNYYEMAKHVDYISYDVYPQWKLDDNFGIALAAKKDLTSQRCLDIHKEFVIMESSPGGTDWSDYTFLKSAKLHEAATFLQVLTGASGCLYFQLKQSRASNEKFHGSVLNINSNTEDRVYQYVKQFGSKLQALDIFESAKISTDVAVFMSWDCANGLRHSSGPRNIGLFNEDFYDYIFEYFNNININCDVVYDERDLELYNTIIIPFGYTISDEFSNKLKTLRNKKVIAFPMLNYVNSDDMLHLGSKPYNLSTEFGINVTELTAIENGKMVADENFSFELIAERVECLEAESLGTFKHEILTNSVTKHCYQDNEYYYIAAMPNHQSLIKLFDQIFDRRYTKGDQVIKNKFIANGKDYTGLINFGQSTVSILNAVYASGDNKEELKMYEFAIVED